MHLLKIPCCVALLVAGFTGARAQSFTKDFVLRKSDAVGMMPAEAVVGSGADAFFWSPDGAFLMIEKITAPSLLQIPYLLQSDPEATKLLDSAFYSLAFYSCASPKVADSWTYRGGSGRLEQVEWLAGTDTAIAIVGITRRDPRNGESVREEFWLQIRASSGQFQVLGSVSSGGPFVHTLAVALRLPMAILIMEDVPRGQFATTIDLSQDRPQAPKKAALNRWMYVLRAGSAMSNKIPLSGDGAGGQLEWAEDGRTPLMLTATIQPGTGTAKAKIVQTAYRLDLGNGTTTQLSAVPNLAGGRSVASAVSPSLQPSNVIADGLSIHRAALGISRQTTTRSIHPIWLVAEFPSELPAALACGDTSKAELAPNQEAVAYMSGSAVMVRRFIHMDKDVFLKAWKAQTKSEIMSQAKQVGMALLILSADMDDKFPGPNENLTDTLDPYLKNRDLMNGFNYTFSGGLMNENPSGIELGYIEGPGGRAVVFGDGHVIWKNNP